MVDKYIFIDMTSVQYQGTTLVNGGGEYALQLFYSIVDRMGPASVCCGLRDGLTTPEEFKVYLNDNKITIILYANDQKMEKVINENDFDTIIFPVCYPKYSYLNIKKSVRLFTVIHDLSSIYADRVTNAEKYVGRSLKNNFEERVKEIFLRQLIKRRHIQQHKNLLRMVDDQYIITVSDYSKFAMQYYLDVQQIDHIIVQYPMNSNVEANEHAFLQFKHEHNIEENKYFLLLSGSRWNKNNLFAAKGIDELFSNKLLGEEYKVVITGVDDVHVNMYRKYLINEEQFVFVKYLEAGLLEALYKNMFSLIYPSLYEGFGFPVVYALKYGKNIVSTTSTSLTEVCLDCAYYFDPTVKEALSVAILRTLYNPIEQSKLKARYSEIYDRQINDFNNVINLICERK